MVMLPPIGQGPKVERRGRTRRVADRVSETAAARSVGEEPFAVDPAPETDPESGRRPPRRGGRRASDKARAGEAGPAKAARAPKPYAPLVAQVIANVMGLEQTRLRRRGTPAEAEALYSPKRERTKRSRGEA